MAGHSKWANIQHRKGAQDAKRGKLFTKFIREITVAARTGGDDMSSNPRLRLAVDKAFAGNMTRETVERAVKRGAGGLDGENVEELRYEGYGPSGIAVIVDCMTDNRNRTASEVRHAFSKSGGNLGTDGSVGYLFQKRGILSFSKEFTEEQLMDPALEAGAEDIVTNDDGTVDVFTRVEDFVAVKEVLIAADLNPENAEVTFLADLGVSIDADTAEKVVRLVDRLEDLDDVQQVYTNADISQDILEQMDN